MSSNAAADVFPHAHVLEHSHGSTRSKPLLPEGTSDMSHQCTYPTTLQNLSSLLSTSKESHHRPGTAPVTRTLGAEYLALPVSNQRGKSLYHQSLPWITRRQTYQCVSHLVGGHLSPLPQAGGFSKVALQLPPPLMTLLNITWTEGKWLLNLMARTPSFQLLLCYF